MKYTQNEKILQITDQTLVIGADIISVNVQSDLEKGYIAVWHDESHFLRNYCRV